MIRRSKTGTLSRQIRKDHEDVDPMSGLANMADVMLCLAVGIMMALVMHWNIDISSTSNLDQFKDSKNLSDKQVEDIQKSNGLQEKGVLYQDPKTGKYYIRIDK